MFLLPPMNTFRTLFSGRLHYLGYFLPTALVIIIVTVGFVRAVHEEHERFMSAQRLAASEQLGQVAASLETNIHGNVNLIHGLVAAISANPSITQAQFSTLAEKIFANPSQLKNVAAAPDLVVRMIYPFAQNKEIIGQDYEANPKQAGSVFEAIKRRTVTVAGPVKLMQGSTGLFARYPVFSSSNGHFWGIVSAVIDVDRLLRDSNVGSERQQLNISIARRPHPKPKDTFFGDATAFSHDSVHARIEVGHDTWYLAAVPKAGWQTTPPQIGRLYAYAGLIALAVIAPMIWAGLLMRQRHGHIHTLEQREEQLEGLHHRLALALEASEVGVWEYEPSTKQLFWDRCLRELYAAPDDRDVFTYEDWRKRVHPDDIDAIDVQVQNRPEHTVPLTPQFRIIAPDGGIRHIRSNGVSYMTKSGIERLVGANWDVTRDINLQTELREARTRAEAQNEQLRATRRTLQHQSLHDALTGLPNRRFLDQFMDASASPSPNHRLAFIHFDMDRFKEVNDTLGHAAGDEVLRQTTTRLQTLLHGDEFASRIGGDEFVVVTSGKDPEKRAMELGRAMVKTLGAPIVIDGHECHVGCSAGIAVQTAAGENPKQLLINADVALYEAKKRGRNRAEIFSENLLLAAIHTKRSSDELLAAIENDEIIPFFQPQFDAQTLDIVGVEALARWQHPTRGLLTPDRFLDIAEGLHRSGDIDAIILQKSLFQATRWRARELDIPRVSVNISAQRLKDETLLTQLADLNIPKGSLSFELLESISFDGQDKALRSIIGQLKDLGIDIEIDDFGSGHASIVSLLDLDPKRLKIDRRLIMPLEASGSQRRLVASIIEIGRSQGIEIVAEGVETIAHADILRHLGCHILQGYAFAKPMPAEAFVTFAENWQAERGNLFSHARQSA